MAEFSRDLDLLALVEPANLDSLDQARGELGAERIAVPELDARHFARGHEVHFRCRREDVAGLWIDIMSTLRGMAPFDRLWERRTTVEVDGESIDLLAINDLVQAKTTQRDKDWPMIRRMVEVNYFENQDQPRRERVEFWLRELRTPQLLVQVAAAYPERIPTSLRFSPPPGTPQPSQSAAM